VIPRYAIRAGRFLFPFAFALLFVSNLVSKASAETLTKSGMFGGLKVDYKVVLPNGFDPDRVYPVLMVFPGGTQSMRGVTGELERWTREAARRGYILVSPAAPADQLFFESSDKIFPDFLDMILRNYKVLGGRIHVAGASNGGISAFHVASLYPKYFSSVSVYPGYLDDTTDPMVEALKPLCIYMYVGESDGDWLKVMKQQSDMFRRRGYSAVISVEENQGHSVDFGPENTAHFFDDLDAAAKGCSE
jgi:poly(3-hydroxybutyrate) depolymerase